MTTQVQIAEDSRYKNYLDHGFVGLVEHMGSDQSIEESARMSYGEGTRKKSDTRNLIRYLVRHYHTSPLEMGEVRFHLKVPIFVMRQLVRHRTASLNEYSGRYSLMTDEFYIPEPSRVCEQSSTNKQGSGSELVPDTQKHIVSILGKQTKDAFATYQWLIDSGMTRELARTVLPVSNYTELYWKVDLNNAFKFFRLRLDPHAQEEIRVLADLMYQSVKDLFPISCEAFEDYMLFAKNFSRMEIDILKQCIDVDKVVQLTVSNVEMGMREKQEFIAFWTK